eukprot:CAMPEP_0174254980 /NCGR_PEP_ID=MMETSP0439-20130205/4313_1 /TAXON_ID=0 /ORGANISM="Stereomyxa ramosa, Strain Chinc5" /LENGTH=192 /DNA_ID=CAMNT_0015336907 /DNA_START=440 /DNA_END=1016 /DNA_ORIENTATION=+
MVGEIVEKIVAAWESFVLFWTDRSGDNIPVDTPEIPFAVLQIIAASFKSFAHGANDVANSVGPLAAIIAVYRDALDEGIVIDWYILFGAGIAIVLGLSTFGYRVMETIGKKIAKVTPSKGYTIELGSTISVLLASRLGLPVSTTHASVGSVVFVGLHEGTKGVDWGLVLNVILSWFITIPVPAFISAALYVW